MHLQLRHNEYKGKTTGWGLMSGNKIINLYDENNDVESLSVDEVIAQNKHHFGSWICGAGIKNLYIDYDGNIWKCNSASANRARDRNQRIDFTSKNMQLHKGYIGSIYEDFQLPTSWFVCPWKSCPCGADILIPKSLPNHVDKLIANSPDNPDVHNDRPNSKKYIIPVATETFYPLGKQILWDIGRRCNYSCSYCWPGSHSNTEGFIDWEIITATTDKIINSWSQNIPIRWYFGGGEPTVHPRFLDWMKMLKDKNQWTLVTSNGSRPYKYWAELTKYLNAVNLSVHFEFADEKKLIDNIKAIVGNFGQRQEDGFLEIKLMATPISLNRAIDLKNAISEGKLLSHGDKTVGSVSLVPIRTLDIAEKLVEYTSEQLQILARQV
jgi:organic radical activating enzyme